MKLSGKVSVFGGPNDSGVSPSEGLALLEPGQLQTWWNKSLFLTAQPTGTTGLARRLDPDAFYCAMEWDYKATPKEVLLNSFVLVSNPKTGRFCYCRPVDWGPHSDTGRLIDLSPGAAIFLGLETDQVADCELVVLPQPDKQPIVPPGPPNPPPLNPATHVWEVGDDHFLKGVQKDIIEGGDPLNVRRCLVIHYTEGASAKSSIDYDRSIGLSAHLYVDRDGTVYQCRPFNKECAHAGKSRWRDPKTGQLYVGANNFALGIEIANAGDNVELAKKWTKDSLFHSAHRNGGPVKDWERFTPEQFEAVCSIAKVLVARYKLDDITGHDCIAPERKNDPGPAFPMKELREASGFSGLPVVHYP